MTTKVHEGSGVEPVRGSVTLGEIRHQPDLWQSTLDRIAASGVQSLVAGKPAIICGAGTSAYAASAVAASWTNASAIPTTDLLLLSHQDLARRVPSFVESGVLVSLARSGDSPESNSVVARMQKMFPKVSHLALTCNERGKLAHSPGVSPVVLDPLTNDRSLAMTSAFTNLVIAGLAIYHGSFLGDRLAGISAKVKVALPELESTAQKWASQKPSRLMVLTSAGLAPLASEACLKILEMTAGRSVALPETFLGVRHGPMSFLRPDSMVLCVLSSDADVRRYELDLLNELRQKNLGKLVVVGSSTQDKGLAHELVGASAGDLPDILRTPFEIVFFQLLAYHLSLAWDLDPDNPSPDGVITRVVQQFRTYQ